MGTAIITSSGMVGRFHGWIIPKSIHNLAFAIGSIVKKPWVVENEIQIRDILNLTILFDHDVVDGVPAARFTAQLVKNIEKSRHLENLTTTSP
jgi:pyruvate/2-oxoglutarate dehydrogenase complex dihydrolipoamide acyltransferase (E2) component